MTTKDRRKKERADNWRSQKNGTGASGEKKFLTPAEKKKIAFITQEFHDEAASVNAYVMFAYSDPSKEPVGASPADVAAEVVTRCDGTTFMDRTIRVDRVGEKRSETDPKRSIFGRFSLSLEKSSR